MASPREQRRKALEHFLPDPPHPGHGDLSKAETEPGLVLRLKPKADDADRRRTRGQRLTQICRIYLQGKNQESAMQTQSSEACERKHLLFFPLSSPRCSQLASILLWGSSLPCWEYENTISTLATLLPYLLPLILLKLEKMMKENM